jgi:ferredoxin, 2Fe-2S
MIAMVKIIYREASGTEHVRDVADGTSVMRGALEMDVPGMQAECGGAAACATCQVRVDPDWFHRLPQPQHLESSMLDEEDLEGRVRLSCQIFVTPELEGMVVEVLATRR